MAFKSKNTGGAVSNKAFFSFIAFALLGILAVVGIVFVIRDIRNRFFSKELSIQSIARRSARPLLVNHPDLTDKPVFGNVILVLDERGEVKGLCGDACDAVSLRVDEAPAGSLYLVKDRNTEYLLLCGYVAPRFTPAVNAAAKQKCLDDYRGDKQLSITFSKNGEEKIVRVGFNDFVLK